MDSITNFFSGYTPAELIAGIIAIIAFFYPGWGVSLMNAIKESMGLEGRSANLLIIGMLMVVSVVATWATGGFADFGAVNLMALVAQAGTLYMLSQDAYKRIYDKPVEL